VLSVPTWLAQWAERDGCAADYDVFFGSRTVTGMRWSGCRGGAEVVAYRIAESTHAAPGPLLASRSPPCSGASSARTGSADGRSGERRGSDQSYPAR
jgi:poly(3-hydroxybutyrate) depolymerase